MAVNTGYYANWPRSIKRPIQSQGTEVLLMATSDAQCATFLTSKVFISQGVSSADKDLWGQNVPVFYSSCCVFCSYNWLPFIHWCNNEPLQHHTIKYWIQWPGTRLRIHLAMGQYQLVVGHGQVCGVNWVHMQHLHTWPQPHLTTPPAKHSPETPTTWSWLT